MNILKSFAKKLLFGQFYPALYRYFCRKNAVGDEILLLELRFGRLSDNLAPYYRHYKKQGRKVRVLCLDIENRKGADLLRAYSRMFRALSRARLVYLTESSNVLAAVKVRKETKLIQVWHACGAFKRFGYGLYDAPKEAYYNDYDLTPVSGGKIEEIYAQSMHQAPEKVRALGVARTDICFSEIFMAQAAESVRMAAPASAGKQIIAFIPTFRGNVARAQMPALPDIARLSEAWKDKAVILYKGHPAVKERPQIPEGAEDFFLDVTDSVQTEHLMAAADILITDYSSVIFDFSLYQKPMIFYTYDLSAYDDGRGFYFPFRTFVPGTICGNTEELVCAGTEALDGVWDREKVRTFRKDFMGACDGHSLQRITDAAERILHQN